MAKAIRETGGLYDRALRGHAPRVGIAASANVKEFAAACDRVLELRAGQATREAAETGLPSVRQFEIADPELWERVLGLLSAKAKG